MDEHILSLMEARHAAYQAALAVGFAEFGPAAEITERWREANRAYVTARDALKVRRACVTGGSDASEEAA